MVVLTATHEKHESGPHVLNVEKSKGKERGPRSSVALEERVLAFRIVHLTEADCADFCVLCVTETLGDKSVHLMLFSPSLALVADTTLEGVRRADFVDLQCGDSGLISLLLAHEAPKSSSKLVQLRFSLSSGFSLAGTEVFDVSPLRIERIELHDEAEDFLAARS